MHETYDWFCGWLFFAWCVVPPVLGVYYWRAFLAVRDSEDLISAAHRTAVDRLHEGNAVAYEKEKGLRDQVKLLTAALEASRRADDAARATAADVRRGAQLAVAKAVAARDLAIAERDHARSRLSCVLARLGEVCKLATDAYQSSLVVEAFAETPDQPAEARRRDKENDRCPTSPA